MSDPIIVGSWDGVADVEKELTALRPVATGNRLSAKEAYAAMVNSDEHKARVKRAEQYVDETLEYIVNASRCGYSLIDKWPDQDIRPMVANTLRKLGYDVIEPANTTELKISWKDKV